MKIQKEQTEKERQEFEKILQEAEDPKNIGQGSWALPRGATPLEKTKYEVCQTILAHLLNNKLTDKEIVQRINLSWEEIEDILFCRVRKFNLDKVVDVANQLLAPCEIKIALRRTNSLHVRV